MNLLDQLFKTKVQVAPARPLISRKSFGVDKAHQMEMQAFIAEVIGHSVSSVSSSVEKFGELYVYRYLPWGKSDPPFLYCDTNHAALMPYWKAQGPAIHGKFGSAWRFDKAIEHFRRNAYFEDPRTSKAQIGFGVTVMLAFKNEVILRH